MVLQRQDLELPLTGGLSQQIDARVLPAGRWARVDNMVPDRQGALTKRHGYGLIPRETYPPGDTVSEVVDVIDSRRDELLAYGERRGASRVWAWSPTLERWIDKGSVSPCSALLAPVASAYAGVTTLRLSVTDGGARAWTWIYPYAPAVFAGDQIVQRIEEASGAVRQNETSAAFAAGALAVEQVSVGDSVVIVWTDAGAPGPFQFRSTDTLTGAVITGTIGPITISRFAACPYDSTRWLVAYVDAAFPADVSISMVDASGTPLSAVTIGGLNAAALALDARVGVGGVLTVWSAGSVVTLGLVDALWTVAWGPQTDVAGPVIVQAMGNAIAADGRVQSCASWQTGIGATLSTTSTARDSLGALTASNIAINTLISHQPFWSSAGAAYVSMTQSRPGNEIYGATCLVRVDAAGGPTIAATLARNAGGFGTVSFITSGQCLPRMIQTSPDVWVAPIEILSGNQQVASLLFAYDTSASSCTLDFEQRQSALRWGAEQRDCLAHSGAYTGWYDGTCDVETGFVAEPAIRSHTASAVGGGMVDGTYLYACVWEWYDERGNFHQSAPTLPYPVALTGGTATQSVVLFVETLALTRKGDPSNGVGKEVTLAVYRTDNAGTLFYRLSPPRSGSSNATVNVKTVDLISYGDTIGNASLVGFGFLYTTGDVLENQIAPAARAIVSTKNRLWIASAENPREVWFSKTIVGGEGPGFNSSLTITLDDANDEVTALAALDDKVVIFTRMRTYYVSGDGPNDTGGGGSFLGPFRLPVDIGCGDQRSCVTYPEGVMYWDGSQIQRLNRGLQIEPIGDFVLDVTGRSLAVIGKIDPLGNRIYFLVFRAPLFGIRQDAFAVYDYKFSQWVTHTQYGEHSGDPPFAGPVGMAAQHWHDGEHWLSTDDDFSNLARTNYGAFSGYDTNTWFPGSIETPWIHVAGVNGYQRAWDVTITGQRLTQHSLVVEVFTDYDDLTIRQSMTVDVQAGSPMLGLPVERLSLRLRSQLCSAVKIRVRDTSPEDPAMFRDPTGWDVVGVTIGLGIKPGGARLPALNRG